MKGSTLAVVCELRSKYCFDVLGVCGENATTTCWAGFDRVAFPGGGSEPAGPGLEVLMVDGTLDCVENEVQICSL